MRLFAASCIHESIAIDGLSSWAIGNTMAQFSTATECRRFRIEQCDLARREDNRKNLSHGSNELTLQRETPIRSAA